ncbi:MAG: hypothetical protein IKX42_05230 [Fibrobacter sp.]|nr:hypothetical protein [Fibrobacter sp.]
MKKILFLALIGIAVANAAYVLDASKFCNDGVKRDYDQTGVLRYNIPGIPDTSCHLTASAIFPGQNIPFNEPVSAFFFDQDVQFKLNGSTDALPIRFFIYSDQNEYSSVQALVETATALRANMNVIFVNPNVHLENVDRHHNNQNCYANKDNSGKVVSINCPLQAIHIVGD